MLNCCRSQGSSINFELQYNVLNGDVRETASELIEFEFIVVCTDFAEVAFQTFEDVENMNGEIVYFVSIYMRSVFYFQITLFVENFGRCLVEIVCVKLSKSILLRWSYLFWKWSCIFFPAMIPIEVNRCLSLHQWLPNKTNRNWLGR